MQRTDSTGRTTRRLLASDRDNALDLLQDGLREVPLYRWLLGDDTPADVYRWYGEILFIEHLSGLRGIFDESGALIALIAVATSSEQPGRADEDLKSRSRRYIQSIDGFAQRFAELQAKTEETAVAEDPVRVIFALVHPDHRGGGIFAALVEPVVEQARRLGLPLTASSSDPKLSELYAKRWNCLVRGHFTLTGGPTVWVQRIDT